MLYQSTRNAAISIEAAQAIAQGLSREGGLFVPNEIPVLKTGSIDNLLTKTYIERAAEIMMMFLADFTEAEISEYTKAAYSPTAFDDAAVAPVLSYDNETAFLELWHGPTCAFKDMALQMLPHLLSASLTKTKEPNDVCILVATSGDTGKAALEGFRDVPRTKIMVFYPEDGVSDVQKLQMTTQEGNNVGVCAVKGNFDDAQTGVKVIFSDEQLRESLSQRGYFLSSANSINWGRLLPQIVYYISAYCDLVARGSIKNGDKINFCVPTGNFGNILAGWYAKKMGLPIDKLICASNCNDVLTEFINTGVYNRNRHFKTTISPSMDILVSSNLERLLFELSGKDDKLIAGYMNSLNESGVYTVSKEIFGDLSRDFKCGWSSDEETKATIKKIYKERQYLIDTHTAVAVNVLEKYRENSGDNKLAVVVSTASPFKFCDSVLEALGEDTSLSGLELIDKLEAVTSVQSPAPLKTLKDKAVRFNNCMEKHEMKAIVEQFLA